MTWVRGARCNRSGANAGERSAAPGPKIATVEPFLEAVEFYKFYRSPLTHCDTGIYVHGVTLRSLLVYSVIRELSGTRGARHAEATRAEARKPHRPPQATGAEKTLLRRDLSRRLPGL